MLPAIPPWIRPDVGRGGGVDPAQPHVGDRPGRRGDGAATLLRCDPGVGRPADESQPQGALRRRGRDHVSDRRGVVVAVPEAGL